MKLITLHEKSTAEKADPIEINPALIFSLKSLGKLEGTLINGTIAVRESLAEVKAHLPKPGRKQTF